MTGLPLGESAKVRGDGTFEIKGLTGRRILRAVPPAGWFLKSVKVNDADVTDSSVEFKSGEAVSGVEFVLTQRSSTLSGTVQDSKGQALTDYVVVAFASDSRKGGTLSIDRPRRAIVEDQPSRNLLMVRISFAHG